ncbi:hypothetical protein HNQ07_004237 [Deinococcus metalli]|nr:hypothetical protein [Deinococcus metalli]MBB5378730.1 hypothetical protein [Deinococcus metalli]
MSKTSLALPEVLKSYPALDKLTYLYVRDHPGIIHVQDMVDHYGHHFQTMAASLRLLRANGLVIATKEGGLVPGEGREAGAYRVATAEELQRAQVYDPAMKAKGKAASTRASRMEAPGETMGARTARRQKGQSDTGEQQ